jgi:peptidoglycan/xylan/chitin deacetylase (PgdA/CDA1 family)
MSFGRRGRSLGLTAFAFALGVGAVMPVQAQQGRQPAAKCDPSRALGVSRVIEIDTSTGPRFGHQQYKELDLLAEGEVILTFDDGPLRVHTQAVVDALETQCTKATFFMVGSQALADPDMVRQIMRRGHTVGTHTWGHVNLRQLSPLAARQELELGFSAVTLAAGQPIAPFFRFPFLADSKAMRAHGENRQLGIFSIDVDSLDYRHKENPQAVRDEVMNQLAYQKKGILLFHDIQPSTAAALPSVLASLKAKGFKVVQLKAKATATTLPEFDVMAQREMGKKRVARASDPLANRAVTWARPSQVPGAAAMMPPPSNAAPLPPSTGAGQPFPPYLPPSVAVAPLPGATPPPVRVPRPRPDEDWRSKVYNLN